MADNATLTPASGGPKLATDEIDGIHYQKVKVADGTDGSTDVVAKGNGEGGLLVTVASDSTGVVKLASGSETIGEAEIGAATSGLNDLAAQEGAAFLDGKTGVQGLALRQDTPSDTSGADGDYEPIHNAGGKSYVDLSASVADDAASTDHPAILGGSASSGDSVSAEGDAAQNTTDKSRRKMVSELHPRNVKGSVSGSTAATTEVIAAPGENLGLYVTDAVFSSGGAQTFTLKGGSGSISGPFYVPANATVRHKFTSPIKVNENLACSVETSAAQDFSATVTGYVSGATPVPSNLANDLVSFWSFDEAGASDTRVDSISGNNLSIFSNPVTVTTGLIGNAVDITSQNNYLIRTGVATADYVAGDGSFTLACWGYRDSNTSVFPTIFTLDKGQAATQISFSMRINSDETFTAFTATGGAFYVINPAGVTPLNDWALYWMRYDGSTSILSCGINDATPTTLGSVPAPNSLTAANIRFGGNSFTANWFYGALDLGAIWERPLTDAEILEYWNGGAGMGF